MAIDKVKEYFKPLHMEEHILEFDVSSATVELAAEALHCEGKRIANVFLGWRTTYSDCNSR